MFSKCLILYSNIDKVSKYAMFMKVKCMEPVGLNEEGKQLWKWPSTDDNNICSEVFKKVAPPVPCSSFVARLREVYVFEENF